MTAKAARRPRKPARRTKTTGASTFTQKYARTVLAPLARKEAAAATTLALETVLQSGTVRRDRVRIYGPWLHIEKPETRDGKPGRMVWVRLRDRDRGEVHEIIVQRNTVVRHTVDPDASPPFSDEERQDAARVIAEAPALGKLVARKDVAIEWFNPHAHGRGRFIGARIVRVKDTRVIEQIAAAEVELDAGVLYKPEEHR
ncbi:MAG TPA: hypothetical protein VHI99_14445 [Vicinamibacterales bacterium]|jgi:hypothetical protein|nr:hypothetical protein [Vicinamibacterales bacterium]